MQKIFLDCEFNSHGGELISLALVPEDATLPDFYEALWVRGATPWVQEHVLPVVNRKPVSYAEFQRLLEEYLVGIGDIQVIADWPEDIRHFCECLIKAPGKMMPLTAIDMRYIRLPEAPFKHVSAIPHNAREDAKALRANYLAFYGDDD